MPRCEKLLGPSTVLVVATLACDWKVNTNIPDWGGETGDDGAEFRTFFVGDAHTYDGACGLSDFTYCSDAYACDVSGFEISNALTDLQWQGVFSDNDLHEYRMWKEAGAPNLEALDFQFADGHNVAWYLGHGNIGYISFSQPHQGDPWSNPCVIGGPQMNLGIKTINGPNIGAGGHASVFVHLSSCGGYYGPGYNTTCADVNWDNNVRQMLAFGGSPVISYLQARDFIEDLKKGKDNLSAWLDVMHVNHEQPFAENNPVVYTYAALSEVNQLDTISDNANMLTGEWVTPPLPTSMSEISISAHTGSDNLGNTNMCLPASAPVSCQ